MKYDELHKNIQTEIRELVENIEQFSVLDNESYGRGYQRRLTNIKDTLIKELDI